MVASTDGLGKVTAYTYDGVGRIATENETTSTFPNGLTTSFTYDGAGAGCWRRPNRRWSTGSRVPRIRA